MSVTNFLIAVAPLAMLMVLLCLGRYPGESAIGKLRTLIETATIAVVRKLPDSGRLPTFQITIRGGRLIASSLAGRGPPIDQ